MNEVGKQFDNPRYIAYAKAHGKTPEEVFETDQKEWPGGCMCGFMLWISRMKQEFFKVSPESFLDRWTIIDQDAWTKFLQEKAAQ